MVSNQLNFQKNNKITDCCVRFSIITIFHFNLLPNRPMLQNFLLLGKFSALVESQGHMCLVQKDWQLESKIIFHFGKQPIIVKYDILSSIQMSERTYSLLYIFQLSTPIRKEYRASTF